MKILSLLIKNIILQIRDYWALLITISLGPFFVVIYWLITAGFPSYYNVLIVNTDSVASNNINYSKQFIEMCLTNKRVVETMHIKIISTVDSGKIILKKHHADAMLMLPPNFSKTLNNYLQLGKTDSIVPNVYFYGEKSNTRYLVGVIASYTAIDGFIKNITNTKEPWNMVETFIDEEKIKRSDFDLQIPGILILSIIMILFSAGMLIIRDIEDKSINRLKLSKMTVFDYVSGVTLTQIMVGVISVVLTYIMANLFGFKSLGSIASLVIICIVAFVGIIGITFMVVSFCKNATVFVLAGQFPLFILIFFSGAMIPIPRNAMFTIFGNAICWNDFLPVGMSVISLNAVFNDGKSIPDLKFQLIYSILISVLYLFVGLYLFNKKHLQLKT